MSRDKEYDEYCLKAGIENRNTGTVRLGNLDHMNLIQLEAMVLHHAQQIKDIAAHLLELKQFTAMFKPGVSLTQGGVAPTMEFNSEKRTAKCSVKDCESRMGQEYFNGFLCTPCHQFVSGVGGLYSQAAKNQQAMVDAAITIERGRVAKFLEHLPGLQRYMEFKRSGWVGLTGDEIEDLPKGGTWGEVIRAAEAILREKNGG